ncbi:glutamate--cysteine ligase [Alkalilimnicola sp. S0819]|uniref:glutamate--cysteine ligase n=1 Tax=Alkalilimnicola sp. S0819 TaxID=2613922 RepID=UPI00126179E6|nr:glutamate--cysteine ligase [Alkalilimnicola sp. S0819]KAB7623762.1 glutamate--cysteine ligase [Alkalilimnicola sp. S0819]MPQ16634.1 glutamate--cysteine ligase [Alkalilimnicola sp. S0819]
MGTEIDETRFDRDDFLRFSQRLRDETRLYKDWLSEGRFVDGPRRMGLELEAWLVDEAGRPAPCNAQVLESLHDPLLSPELAQYNLELNTHPLALRDTALSDTQRQLEALWARVAAAAAPLGVRPGMIGILPSVTEDDLCLARMSKLRRYQALNEQVLLLRNREPLSVDIRGEERVQTRHADLMLESAATSLQLHLQVGPAEAPAFYNAAAALSAATVALAANAPFLFGRSLWEETRIPLFEQAVAVGPLHGGHAGPLSRVGFGSGYARDGLYSFFVENRQHYPVLLPVPLGEPAERLPHLRLHNGTIWRWNRPLVGFEEDGRPHLRIEHRVMSAGPSFIDTLANAAFFYGAVHALAAGDRKLPYPVLEANFYAAARHGLRATIHWGGGEISVQRLILTQLLPAAAQQLQALGLAQTDIDRYLGVIEARVSAERTGAAWQRQWVGRHGRDFAGLTRAYLKQQAGGEPVHAWPI